MARATATVPVRVGAAAPAELGAKNQRTGKSYPGQYGPTLAIREAANGDTILVNPGTGSYPIGESFSKSLTLQSSVTGMLSAPFDGLGAGNRLFNPGVNCSLTLEDIDLSNNKKLDANGAGIAPDGGKYDLVLRRCRLRELCNGILIGAHPQSTVLLEDSEFVDCGWYDGKTHNIYVGHVANFTMRRCWSHMVKKRAAYPEPWRVSWGHLVKSRAAVTVIEDCRLTMENSEANRCIDLPNGGDVTIRRNKLEYWTTQNGGAGQLISFGVEELVNPLGLTSHKLVIEDNIAVNRAGPLANFLWVAHDEPTVYSVKNNIFAGPNMPSVKGDQKWAIPLSQNRVVELTDFVDVDKYDWSLK